MSESNCCIQQIAIPGPMGPAGDDGTNGTNGVNAYMTLTGNYTMPAELASSAAATTDNSAFTVGQTVFVLNLGVMQITAKGSTTATTLKNLEDTSTSMYPGNAAPGTVASSGSSISPAGTQGASGSITGAAGGDLAGTFPNPTIGVMTTAGDILTRNATVVARLGVGTDGKRIKADSTQATGLLWDKVNLNVPAEIAGTLPVGNGGTGLTTGTDGGILAFTAAGTLASSALLVNYVPIIGKGAGVVPKTITAGVGTAGQVLTSGGAGVEPSWGNSSVSGVPKDFVYFCHMPAANQPGGSSAALLYLRPFTVASLVNPSALAVTVTTSTFTLPAGTYRCKIRCPAYAVGLHKAYLQNTTAGTTTLVGSNAISTAAAALVESDSWIQGRFTIAASSTFNIYHHCATPVGTNDFGIACNFSMPPPDAKTTELYTEVWLEKEAV